MRAELRTGASDQVERAAQRERDRHVSLAADVASSALLLGIVALVTALLVLPVAVVIGIAL